VTSPAVGVFRAELTPGTRVRAGDRIASVDLLGIGQDVMSTIDGTLVEVFPQAGEAVEYGEDVAVVESEVTVETDGARDTDGAAAEPAPVDPVPDPAPDGEAQS
jgi:glycine cleavage system H lipoate-binding protein